MYGIVQHLLVLKAMLNTRQAIAAMIPSNPNV